MPNENNMYTADFLEWIKYNCGTFIDKKDEKVDIFWYLREDIHPWDNVPSKVYNTEELHQYWKNTITNEK